jgi:WD40 repeat protein
MAGEQTFDKARLAWTLPWDADWVTAVCFLGPTRQVAAGNRLGEIMVWDLPARAGERAPTPARRFDGHSNSITRLLATSDGRWLISSSYDHGIRYWDLRAPTKGSASVVLNARTRAEAARRRWGKVPPAVEVKVATQQAARTLAGHREWVQGIALSRDGKVLVSADDDGQVIVWDRPAGKELRRWKVTGWCYAVALSPDNKQVAVSERRPLVFDAGRHAGIRLWYQEGRRPMRDLGGAFKGMHLCAAAYSPDGKLLALGRGGEVNGMSGKVFLVDPATGKKVRELAPGHQDGLTDLVFHPDGKHLASSGRDTTVRIWNSADGKLVKQLGKPRGGQFKDWIHAVSFSADGKWLAAGDMAGAVQVWALEG